MIYRLTADARFEADDLEDAKRKLAAHFAEWVNEHGDWLFKSGEIVLEETE